MQVLKISLYLLAIILSNFSVLWFGRSGIIFASLFLMPFDYAMRCYFHEKWKGNGLVAKIGAITLIGGAITFLINKDTQVIAIASSGSFLVSQMLASLFYRMNIDRGYFLKVNGSDLVAILADSIIFQMIAFGNLDKDIFLAQIILKAIGGLFWYGIFFSKGKDSYLLRDIAQGSYIWNSHENRRGKNEKR